MYYFLPKAAERPVYSYRLSVIHFWSLVFVYIWAGPHHLLNSALPGWLQNLGMTFSLMLWAPSWGGMLNGLLTLRGAWDRGIGGIRALFEVDTVRRRTQMVILVFSIFYNVLAVGLSVAGKMNPLIAAILMPVNSLATLAIVTGGMRRVFRAAR